VTKARTASPRRITAGAVALFCLISGCVYVLNDLVDVEKDRAHPKKRNRPIPSGKLPEVVARRFVVVAVPLFLGLGYWLQPWYAAALAGYFALNLAYSFRLKQIAYIDVMSIAAGFILRVVAGAFALQVVLLQSLTGQSIGMRLLGIRVARLGAQHLADVQPRRPDAPGVSRQRQQIRRLHRSVPPRFVSPPATRKSCTAPWPKGALRVRLLARRRSEREGRFQVDQPA